MASTTNHLQLCLGEILQRFKGKDLKLKLTPQTTMIWCQKKNEINVDDHLWFQGRLQSCQHNSYHGSMGEVRPSNLFLSDLIFFKHSFSFLELRIDTHSCLQSFDHKLFPFNSQFLTSLTALFPPKRLDHKFDLMYAKRAFVHW